MTRPFRDLFKRLTVALVAASLLASAPAMARPTGGAPAATPQNAPMTAFAALKEVKKSKERAETEAKVNKGQMSLFGSFSQGSPGSGNHPSPPPR